MIPITNIAQVNELAQRPQRATAKVVPIGPAAMTEPVVQPWAEYAGQPPAGQSAPMPPMTTMPLSTPVPLVAPICMLVPVPVPMPYPAPMPATHAPGIPAPGMSTQLPSVGGSGPSLGPAITYVAGSMDTKPIPPELSHPHLYRPATAQSPALQQPGSFGQAAVQPMWQPQFPWRQQFSWQQQAPWGLPQQTAWGASPWSGQFPFLGPFG